MAGQYLLTFAFEVLPGSGFLVTHFLKIRIDLYNTLNINVSVSKCRKIKDLMSVICYFIYIVLRWNCKTMVIFHGRNFVCMAILQSGT